MKASSDTLTGDDFATGDGDAADDADWDAHGWDARAAERRAHLESQVCNRPSNSMTWKPATSPSARRTARSGAGVAATKRSLPTPNMTRRLAQAVN